MTRYRSQTPSLASYLNQLGPVRCRRGDVSCIVEANLPLVITISKRYWFEGVFLDDLVQAGNVGLLRAARTYDPERVASFSTWATYSIKDGLLQFLSENQHPVRLPRQVHDRVMSERRQSGEVAVDTPGGRAARLSLSIEAEDAHGFCLADRLQDWATPESSYEVGELHRLLVGLVDQLSDGLRDVVVSRYGLDGSEPVGTVEQARRLGLTREAVRLRHKAALQQLQELAAPLELRCWLESV